MSELPTDLQLIKNSYLSDFQGQVFSECIVKTDNERS